MAEWLQSGAIDGRYFWIGSKSRDFPVILNVRNMMQFCDVFVFPFNLNLGNYWTAFNLLSGRGNGINSHPEVITIYLQWRDCCVFNHCCLSRSRVPLRVSTLDRTKQNNNFSFVTQSSFRRNDRHDISLLWLPLSPSIEIWASQWSWETGRAYSRALIGPF